MDLRTAVEIMRRPQQDLLAGRLPLCVGSLLARAVGFFTFAEAMQRHSALALATAIEM